MSQNYFYPYQTQQAYPQAAPNAVSINIIAPQAYGNTNGATNPYANSGNFYSLYGQNTMPNLPSYPMNYNNMPINQSAQYYQTPQYAQPSQNAQNPQQIAPQVQAPYHQTPQTQKDLDSMNTSNMANSTNLVQKTNVPTENTTEEKKKTKKVVPLTDEYIKSLENYMNDANPKVRLIGAKEVMERFKEDENRKDNPSLMALLNKSLRDSSPSVRFLALASLQLGYALGNDETVAILKEIQVNSQDKTGEEALMVSEILLNMSSADKIDVPMTQAEIEREQAKQRKKK